MSNEFDTIKGVLEKLIDIAKTKHLLGDSTLLSALDKAANTKHKLDILSAGLLKDTKARLKYIEADAIGKLEIIIDSIDPVGKPPPSAQTQALPKTIADRVEQETARLKLLVPGSSEHSHLLDYLHCVSNIPWGKTSAKTPSLRDFTSILDQTHYGLKEVKTHLLEYMTVEQLWGGSIGTVLCFSGPPGVGKTSIAKAIATATNRKLECIALGGLSDEAELRGHRRTYTAARSGRLISSIRHAGVLDPVILLDEVDKISRHQGDPTAALLEILDKEQNHSYIDRYLELPVDLSKVLFICTANYVDQIPPALRDRMEFVQFREYSVDERRAILQEYILPKTIDEYKLDQYNPVFTEDLLAELSRTTQVRDIEKKVKKLLRMAAVELFVEQKKDLKIDISFAKEVIAKPTVKQLGFK
jgi:endopeptidase La